MSELWRAMAMDDIRAVSHMAEVVHPDFPEEDAIFFERLELAPQGCFILEIGSEACGYLFSHPWLAGDVPPLNERLGGLPPKPQTWYLHDLALMPQARGKGVTTPLVRRLVSLAQAANLPSVSLVAVNGSKNYWSHQGFADATTDSLRAKLLSYEPEARYMVRMV